MGADTYTPITVIGYQVENKDLEVEHFSELKSKLKNYECFQFYAMIDNVNSRIEGMQQTMDDQIFIVYGFLVDTLEDVAKNVEKLKTSVKQLDGVATLLVKDPTFYTGIDWDYNLMLEYVEPKKSKLDSKLVKEVIMAKQTSYLFAVGPDLILDGITKPEINISNRTQGWIHAVIIGMRLVRSEGHFYTGLVANEKLIKGRRYHVLWAYRNDRKIRRLKLNSKNTLKWIKLQKDLNESDIEAGYAIFEEKGEPFEKEDTEESKFFKIEKISPMEERQNMYYNYDLMTLEEDDE